MSTKKQILFPQHKKILEIFGENVKLARKRRNLTAIQVAERADISRNTLYLIEKGNSGVSIGAVFNVLRVLGLQDDFLKLGADDVFGRKLQDIELLRKKWILLLKIDFNSGTLDFEHALSVMEYFRLSNEEAESIISRVRKAIGNWEKLAKQIGITRAEIEIMRSAFRV
jgi:transcriptional regulator with XRE-family HTH domain